MVSRLRPLIIVLAASTSMGACLRLFKDDNGSKKQSSVDVYPVLKGDSIEAFATQAEFDQYMDQLKLEIARRAAEAAQNKSTSSEESGSQDAAAPANEAITNNQEAGVDEGGIVKSIGDSLVTLRKGRLHAVALGSPLTLTDAVDVARETSLNQSVWYDELLVSGDKLYVIGYRYQTGALNPGTENPCRTYQGATEINSFRLKNGKFERLDTSFIESYDYFSGNNYASRMVGGKLVFYMPQQALYSCGNASVVRIPQILAYESQGFKPIKPLFSGTDVFKNIEAIDYAPIFHTIVSCALLDSGGLDCQAKAVLGNYSRQKYVSTEAVYLATSDKIYALNLKDLSLRAHAFSGLPLDQFSFKELNGTLHVLSAYSSLSASQGAESAPASTLPADGSQPTAKAPGCMISLFRLPLAAFDNRGQQQINSVPAYEGTNCWVQKNRFVGSHVLFSVLDRSNRGEVQVFDLNQNSVRKIALGGHISRLEVLKDNLAFLVYHSFANTPASFPNLNVATLKLDEADLTLETQDLGPAVEGESRSHGFFQKAEPAGTHILGLPVISERAGSRSWWGSGLSNVAFMRVGTDFKIKALGAAESGSDTSICQTSCTDWYGNTRPIFLGSRIFALMGHELAEYQVEGDTLQPVGTRLTLSQLKE